MQNSFTSAFIDKSLFTLVYFIQQPNAMQNKQNWTAD